MKITLVRTGGIIPLKKKAEVVVNWDANELEQLKTAVKPSLSAADNVRDGIEYHIQYDEIAFPVEWSKIPTKYKAMLEKLKKNLVIEKM